MMRNLTLNYFRVCFFVVWFIADLQLCDLIPHRQIMLEITNSTFIEYSANEKYMAIGNLTTIEIHDGISGKYLWTKHYFNESISQIQFSTDQLWVGVGFLSTTSTDILSQYISINSPALPTNPSQPPVPLPQVSQTLQITGLLFLNDKYFVTSNFQSINIKIIHHGIHKTFHFSNNKIQTMQQINQKNNQIILVVEQSNKLFFNFSKIQFEGQSIEIIGLKSIQIDNYTKIYDIDVNANQSYLFFIADEGKICKMDLSTYQIQQIAEVQSQGPFLKIQVSEDEQIIMITNKTHFILLQKSDKSAYTQFQVTESQKTNNGAATLSTIAGNILYVENKQSAYVVGLCQEGRYRFYENSTLSCLLCPMQCKICQITYESQSPACKLCQQGYYLQKKNCLECSKHCLECTGLHCHRCESPFVTNDTKVCVCPIGMYEKDTTCNNCIQNCEKCSNSNQCITCQSGYHIDNQECTKNVLSTLMLVLIIIGSIIFVLLVALLIYKFAIPKIRKKQSLLILSQSQQ